LRMNDWRWVMSFIAVPPGAFPRLTDVRSAITLVAVIAWHCGYRNGCATVSIAPATIASN
jgi:hypothetical protein